ncbi:hypothetical protein ACVOMS_35515 (plasmid) [Bradyrhizobium guangxiense]|uniref:hypothetical protein n=1 Tax=Bradyrhizobium guangxiense TaxID=1325115 RepID=UPI0037043B5E
MSERVATATNLLDSLRSRVSDYLDRYHAALYATLGTVVAIGIAYNWHWLTTAEFVRVLTKCMKCGISPSDRKNEARHDGGYDAWNDVGDEPDLLLIVIVLVLAAAALIKYLRS